jgi:hypothetical protein
MPSRRQHESDSVVRKLVRDLVVWLVAIGVELACRKLLQQFGENLGLSSQRVRWAHGYMSMLVYCTLLSFATFSTGEVLSIGLRRLLRELTKLVGQLRAFFSAFESRRGEE